MRVMIVGDTASDFPNNAFSDPEASRRLVNEMKRSVRRRLELRALDEVEIIIDGVVQ